MKTRIQTTVLAALLGFAFTTPLHAAPGDLDTTFAGTGKSRIGFGGGYAYGQAAAVQPDGKLVLGGYIAEPGGRYKFALVRFDTNNVLDTSFGDNGRVLTQISTTSSPDPYEGITALGIQSDGKIVAAGFAEDTVNVSFALARYNPDGSLDTSFGTNGKVFTDFSSQTQINGMVIQPDGKILVAGAYVYVTGNWDFLLARYETNGTLDATFGNGGTVDTPIGGAQGLILQSDGTFVVAGNQYYNGLNSEFAVARYTTNGVLDTTFGGAGEVFTPITGNDYAMAVRLQLGNNTIQNPDKLVVAGYTGGTVGVVRYSLSGAVDTTFGNNGIVTNSFGPGDNRLYALAVQGFLNQPRKITIGGFYGVLGTGSNDFGLMRLNSDGSPDTTFGANGTGKNTVAIHPGWDDEARAMTFQGSQIVLAGYSGSGIAKNYRFAAARFNSDGSLDSSFGNGGAVTADIADLTAEAQGVAIQPDGKIVVVGDASNAVERLFAVARYNPDGVLDESFGSNGGKVTTLVGPSNALANAVLIQPDAKIVAAGYSYNGYNSDFAAVRYNADGSLDSSFGDAGQTITPIGFGNDVAKAVALQADGKIVLAGYSYNGANDDFAVVRYTTNGVLDTSFGNAGQVTTAIATGEDQAWAVRVQPDGKIVAVGEGQIGSATDFALVRYNPNGSLDNSFGSLGRVATDFGAGNAAEALAMTIQPDGKIVATGIVTTNGYDAIALARYTTNGVLDASFGAGGKVVTQVGLVYDYGASVAVGADGKIVVAGASEQGANYEYAVLRYNPDGTLDDTYGFGGKMVVSFDSGNDLGNCVALDQIGRAVVAGNANNLFGVMRLASEPFLKFTSINHLPDGAVALQGLGVPEARHTLLDSANLNPGAFNPLDSVTPDAGGFWQYEDTNTIGINSRFYRLSYP